MTAVAPDDVFEREMGPARLRYCPHKPTVKQELFLLLDQLEVFFGGAAGPGKALSWDTPIPTPCGWTTMGAIEPGDVVLASDGMPTTVLATQEVDPVGYTVVFDDGSWIDAHADHTWLTFNAKELEALTRRDPEWRAERRASRPSRAAGRQGAAKTAAVAERNAAHPPPTLPIPAGTLRSTGEIYETLLTPRGRRNHAIPVTLPLELPEADLMLDPYLLGVWLGDGHTDDGMITTADPQILDEIAAAGWECRRVPSAPLGFRIVGLTARLREIGLLGEKGVPGPYLRGSIAQRLALLQGLMDSDGSIDAGGQAEFSSTLLPLAAAVHELACSLGQKPTIHEGRATLDGRDCGPVWRVAWTPTVPVFRLARKLERQSAKPRRTVRFRFIVDVRPLVGPIPMKCIQVGHPSGMFLAGFSMIPTHNSWGLLMAALQYVDIPGYHALLLRPELTQFEQKGGLIEVAHDWLARTDAWWHGTRREWTFPSGATLRFGYLANPGHLGQFKGAAYSFVGFDELTLWPSDRLYRMMFRVLRQAEGGPLENVPVRMRSASNPGDAGHEWVKTHFVDPVTREDGVVFVPASIGDNPHLDYETYLETLSHLPPVERQRLIAGDWDVLEEGGKFERAKFEIVDPSRVPAPQRTVRYWDLAATEPSSQNSDPDYTAGVRIDLGPDGLNYVTDLVRGRWEEADLERQMQQTAELDGHAVEVRIEQEPGASGKLLVKHYIRSVLAGFPTYAGLTRGGDKETRARPWAAAVSNDLVRVVPFPDLLAYLNEHAVFPNKGMHDDCVDASSGAFTYLHDAGPRRRPSRPRGMIPGVAGARRLY